MQPIGTCTPTEAEAYRAGRDAIEQDLLVTTTMDECPMCGGTGTAAARLTPEAIAEQTRITEEVVAELASDRALAQAARTLREQIDRSGPHPQYLREFRAAVDGK